MSVRSTLVVYIKHFYLFIFSLTPNEFVVLDIICFVVIVFFNDSPSPNSSIKRSYCELCEEQYQYLDEVRFSCLFPNNTYG